MSTPKVSVILATYNHAPFVAQAVSSALAQTFDDFELLIADDGSVDATREVVSRFSDRRLEFFPHTENRGACVVINELIERSRGEYIAVLNSDDFWPIDKLAFQVAFMENQTRYSAIFGRASFIDREGAPVAKESVDYGMIFEQDNRSPGRWLRRFFDLGNCLCHPTILVRRECYRELGLYDNRYRQLPDLDMWIRFSKRFRFLVCDRELVFFRILPGENASSQTRDNAVRTMNEHHLIANVFFDGVPRESLIEGFSDLLVHKHLPSPEHCDIEKALLYFAPNQWLGHMYKIVGLNRLFALLASGRHRQVLTTDYGIDDRSFQGLMSQADAFRPAPGPHRLDGVSSRKLLGEIKNRVVARIHHRLA